MSLYVAWCNTRVFESKRQPKGPLLTPTPPAAVHHGAMAAQAQPVAIAARALSPHLNSAREHCRSSSSRRRKLLELVGPTCQSLTPPTTRALAPALDAKAPQRPLRLPFLFSVAKQVIPLPPYSPLSIRFEFEPL